MSVQNIYPDAKAFGLIQFGSATFRRVPKKMRFIASFYDSETFGDDANFDISFRVKD